MRNLLDRFGPLDEKIVRIYMRQILEGLKYLHSKGIVHRNLKCSNILVDNDATIRLSDFGASKRISFSDSYKKPQAEGTIIVEPGARIEFSESLKGSPNWMAPEVILNTGHHKAADIWSVGCVMLEMRTGNPPWTEFGKDPIKILKAIVNNPYGPVIPKGVFSPLAWDCINLCFAKKPEDRPTVDELLKNPFIVNQDEDSDTQARQIVQQMSTKLRQENQTKTGEQAPAAKTDGQPVSEKKPAEISLNSSNSIEFAGPLEPLRNERELVVIKTKVATEMQEKDLKERENVLKQKEERRKKWEEELKKELEKQRSKK